MGKVNWGIAGIAGSVDGFDRSTRYKPYDGPVPPNGVYTFAIKTAKAVPGTKDKHPQLRIGIELTPRKDRKDQRQYAGWFTTMFFPIADNMVWKLTPMLDALGVSGRDFESRTITDNEGKIQRIGQWRFVPGETQIAAEIKDDIDQNGNPRKEIGWVGPANEDDSEDYPDDDEDGADALTEDYDEEDDESEDEDEEEWDEDEDGF